MEESIYIVFDETNELLSRKREGADDAGIIEDGMKELTLNNSIKRIKDQLDEKYEDESINDQNIQEQSQDIDNLLKK